MVRGKFVIIIWNSLKSDINIWRSFSIFLSFSSQCYAQRSIENDWNMGKLLQVKISDF